MNARGGSPTSDSAAGRIVRMVAPRNEEFDFARLAGVITPASDFYIRNHGPVPTLDARRWRLRVGGLVDRPLRLSLTDLIELPHQEQLATLECAGNRRTFQDPVPDGVPWGDGAISTARWGGIPLSAVLQLAGVQPEGQHVLLEGADKCPTGRRNVGFARSVPLETAVEDTALIALMMNGERLSVEQGAPARVVMAGSYAMNSVKWLTRITIQAEPHTGHFQSNDYRLWYEEDGPGWEIGPMRVMATIAAPRPNDRISAGLTRIHGAAWTGNGTVTRVEVSTDGGGTWDDARLRSDAEHGVWRLWEHWWTAVPGEHTLMARATDSSGAIQPPTLPPNRKGYANNFVLPVRVEVQ